MTLKFPWKKIGQWTKKYLLPIFVEKVIEKIKPKPKGQ